MAQLPLRRDAAKALARRASARGGPCPGSRHPAIDHISGMQFAYEAIALSATLPREMLCPILRSLSIKLDGPPKSFPSISCDFGRRLCWPRVDFRYGYFLFHLSRSPSINHARPHPNINFAHEFARNGALQNPRIISR
jgi:hypothetical protein